MIFPENLTKFSANVFHSPNLTLDFPYPMVNNIIENINIMGFSQLGKCTYMCIHVYSTQVYTAEESHQNQLKNQNKTKQNPQIDKITSQNTLVLLWLQSGTEWLYPQSTWGPYHNPNGAADSETAAQLGLLVMKKGF